MCLCPMMDVIAGLLKETLPELPNHLWCRLSLGWSEPRVLGSATQQTSLGNLIGCWRGKPLCSGSLGFKMEDDEMAKWQGRAVL